MRSWMKLTPLPIGTGIWPMTTGAAEPIKIGFPILLSGPTAVYGEPVLKGAEMAVAGSMPKAAFSDANCNCCRATARQVRMRLCACRANSSSRTMSTPLSAR